MSAQPPGTLFMQLRTIDSQPGGRFPSVRALFKGNSTIEAAATAELSIEWFANECSASAYSFDKTYIVTITEASL